MFQNLIKYPIESTLLKWESKIVVRAVERDHECKEQLYLRLKLTGTTFPVFNTIPFVKVGKVKARFVRIADDGLSVKAYFDTTLRNNGTIEFGYDDQVLLRFPTPYHSRHVVQLDNSRLPKHLQYQNELIGHQIR